MPSMAASPLSVAAAALDVGSRSLHRYSGPFSRRDFTQAQLFALLVLKQVFRKDYRGFVQMLAQWSDLRDVLHLRKVPHWTTLHKAEQRLLKKTELLVFSQRLSEEASISA